MMDLSLLMEQQARLVEQEARVLEMYQKATSGEKASWVDDVKESVCSVSMLGAPKKHEVKALVDNLVAYADHKNQHIRELCVGTFGGQFVCYARLGANRSAR